MTTKKHTTVLLCYARSGGTLFSKALASLPDVVLVSEVNPVLNANGTVATQLKNWYDFEVAEGSFAEMANAGAAVCATQSKNFIVRDFSFIDFTPHKLNKFLPKNAFSTLNVLEGIIPVIPIAFVRNAYDVWISRGCPPEFSKHYLGYVKALLALNVPIFTYEDFCENPIQTMKNVCKETGLPFHEGFLEAMNFNKKVTGDVDLKNPSRGNTQSSIVKLQRKRLPQFLIKKVLADPYLAEANALLGYPTEFYDADFESEPSFLKVEMKWFLKRVLLKYPKDVF